MCIYWVICSWQTKQTGTISLIHGFIVSICYIQNMKNQYFDILLLVFKCPLSDLSLPVSPVNTGPGQPNSTCTKTPAQPAQQAAAPIQAGAPSLATTSSPTSATPQGQLPPQTQAHMPIQSPTSLQVKTQGGAVQLQQTPQLISVSGLQQQVQVGLAKRQCWEVN